MPGTHTGYRNSDRKAHAKSESLSCRVAAQHKQLIERAARQSGFSLSDYVTHTLIKAATEALKDESVIRLTKEEWDNLTTSLERPAREPSEATRKAIEIFKLGRDEGDRQIW